MQSNPNSIKYKIEIITPKLMSKPYLFLAFFLEIVTIVSNQYRIENKHKSLFNFLFRFSGSPCRQCSEPWSDDLRHFLLNFKSEGITQGHHSKAKYEKSQNSSRKNSELWDILSHQAVRWKLIKSDSTKFGVNYVVLGNGLHCQEKYFKSQSSCR